MCPEAAKWLIFIQMEGFRKKGGYYYLSAKKTAEFYNISERTAYRHFAWLRKTGLARDTEEATRQKTSMTTTDEAIEYMDEYAGKLSFKKWLNIKTGGLPYLEWVEAKDAPEAELEPVPEFDPSQEPLQNEPRKEDFICLRQG